MIPPLFLDKNVGRRVRECLIAHGFPIRTHRDIELPPGTSDEEWIAAVGQRGWAALTMDIKQSRRANEKRAIRHGRLKHIVVHSRSLTAEIATEIINQHVVALKIVLAYLPPPFTLRLLRDNTQLKSYHTTADLP